MLRLLSALVLLVVVAIAYPAHAADGLYRDLRQPSFTLLVPDGWTATRDDQGVTVRRGRAWAKLGVMGPVQSVGALFVQMRPQIERQTRDFRELDSGRITFGGQPGLFLVYSGIPAEGTPAEMRMVATTNGRMTYILWLQAPAGEADRLKPDFDRIQASFSPDPAR